MATAHELQERLSPKTLAKDAWQGAKEKGADLAEDAVDAVRGRPLAATGVVAAIAMFLAREPLIDLAGKLAGGVGEKRKTRKTPQGRKPEQDKTENSSMTDQDNSTPTRRRRGSSPRQRAIEAYDGARERAADTLGEAPLIALAGGIAAGALIAALLPRTDAETRARPPDRAPGEGQRARRARGRARHRHASGSTSSASAARRARKRSAACSTA